MRIASIATATALALIAITVTGGEASAQSGSADAILQSFSKCRSISVVEAQLDCFDKAAQALEKAVKTHDVTITNRQEVRSAQRSLFGFNIGRIALFGTGGDRSDESMKRDVFDRLDTTIVSTQQVANGNVQLRVAEGGAVWVSTDAMPFPPHAGTKVSIRRGALGNYFINVEGQRSVRGTRLR